MRFFGVAACCALSMGALGAWAQMGASAAGPAVGSMATPSAAFDSQLSLIEDEMMGAVKAMPAEKYDFAPSTAIFSPTQKTEFATVRTFAQQATHVAEANYFFANILSGLKPDVDVRAIEKLTKKDDIVAALAIPSRSIVFPSPRSSQYTRVNVLSQERSHSVRGPHDTLGPPLSKSSTGLARSSPRI